MSHAADQTLSTRGDAKGFADAFAAAEEAFVDPSASASRTMTLAELEVVLDLHAPVDLPAAAPRRAPEPPSAQAGSEPELLTLAELGEVLARPQSAADALEFDFGSGTAERARRRTAARTQPAAGSTVTPPDAGPSRPTGVPSAGGSAVSPASAARVGAARPAPRTSATRTSSSKASATPAVGRLGGSPIPSATGRRPLPGSAMVHTFRSNPDRVALYAVLLGILLVLIAASSASAATAASAVTAALSLL